LQRSCGVPPHKFGGETPLPQTGNRLQPVATSSWTLATQGV